MDSPTFNERAAAAGYGDEYSPDNQTGGDGDSVGYGELSQFRDLESLRAFAEGRTDRSLVRRSFRVVDKDEINKNFKVAIRVRPPLPRELEGDRFVNCVRVESGRSITLSENFGRDGSDGDGADGVYATHTFTFDQVYDQTADQKSVYETTARDAVMSTLQVLVWVWVVCFLTLSLFVGLQRHYHCIWTDRHGKDVHDGRFYQRRAAWYHPAVDRRDL